MLKRYSLPSIKGEGWAQIVIDTEWGFFATVSDWGSYSFMWTAPGCEFRKFLTELQPDYLYGKLMMGRPKNKEFDEKKTEENIRQAIEDKNKEADDVHAGWEYYEEELEILSNRLPMDEANFESWESETRLTDVWELAVYSPCHDCMGFCTKIWPRFVELLKKELEEELAQNKSSSRYGIAERMGAELRAQEDANFEKHCDEAAKAMTGPDRDG